MRKLPNLSRCIHVTAVLLAASWVSACSDLVTDADRDTFSVRAAKGGNGNGKGGGGGGGGPKVDDVDPSAAPQGTRLDVRVLGSGYDATSTVEMLLDGVATGDITTNSTTFVSNTELIADITIASDAVTDFYDVEVTAGSPPKRGIGVEKFEVLLAVASPTSGGIVATDRNGGSEIPMARGDQDNSKTLDISDGGPGPTDGSNPLITLGFSYGAGFDRSQCVKVGNELPITKDEYIDVLTGSPPPSASFVDTEVAFPIKISKTRLGQEYNKQWIQVWRSDTSGLIWIARVIASGREGLTGNGDPLVTAQPVTPPAGDTRTWMKYTFEAGHGEIRVTTRFSSDFVECPYLPADEISVTVIDPEN